MTVSTTDLSGALERRACEQRIARMYADILGIQAVDIDADFFALGGNSLGAMQLLASINEAFCSDLQFGDLVDHATPRAIAASIESAPARHDEPTAPEKPQGNVTTYITRGQLLFWRLGRRRELASYFNLRQGVMLHGPLDIEALGASLQALADRHESLRMHFRPHEDSLAQDVELIIPEQRAVAFVVLEAPADTLADPPAFVRELLQKELEQPFDLLSEPLIRFKLVRFSPTLHAFLVTMHHLITDAWSFNVLRRELNQLYSARVKGQPDPLAPLPLRYSEHARANRRLHESDPYRRELNYWDNLLASLGPVEADLRSGTDRGDISGTGYADLSISEADFLRLAQRSSAHSTTPYVLLQALMHLTLYSVFSGLEKMLVLSPANDRHRPEIQDSIGLHITIVGVVSTISRGMKLRQFIAQLKRSVHEALEHYESRQFASYDLAKHRAGDFPLFVYNYFLLQNDCGWGLDDLAVEPVFPTREDPRAFVTLLELYHARGPSGLWGQLKYDLAQVDQRSAERFIVNYRRILEAVLSSTDDDMPIAGLIGR